MTTLDILNDLDVATPCKASWGAMAGDDRMRFCLHCRKNVYNIAEMTGGEVVDLIRRTEGEFCGRLYRRRDGTVLTADCPVGLRPFSSGVLHRALTYGVLGVGFLTTGAMLRAAGDRTLSWPPTGPGVTFADWKDWALWTLGLAPTPVPRVAGAIRAPVPVMGKPVMPPRPAPPPAPASTTSGCASVPPRNVAPAPPGA